MNFQIANGATADINQGSMVTVKPGYLPEYYNGKQLTITKVSDSETPGKFWPYTLLHREEIGINEDGDEITEVVQYEECALSPEIISSVT